MVHQHGDHHEIPHHHRVHKPGAWLPADHRIHRKYLSNITAHIDNQHKAAEKFTPAVQELKHLIENDSRIYMFFVQMFDEIPRKHPYWHDPTGTKQIRNYTHMLQVINHIVTRAPEWTMSAESVGVVGVPFCALLDYPMATPSGHAAFLDPDVNKALKKVLNEWGKYLKSPESAYVLTNKEIKDKSFGWFSESAVHDMLQVANAPLKSQFKFEDVFVCDPTAEHYGFKSWDDFFTRKIHDSARPVASPDDNSVIANACESKVYNIEHGVKLRDKFFAKGQPYSLQDMLAQDPLAHDFVGGTVYQAFLSALSYHRWHSPVSGKVKRAFVVDGTYFSEPIFESTSGPGGQLDTDGITLAQGYLSALATRAIIVLEAEFGLVAFIGIGMDEVSTCEITVKEGQEVRKGDELGMFHFGGSSHVLLFPKGVKVTGFPEVGRDENVPVRSKLAVVE